MNAHVLSVVCANCGGDELLSRLVAGTTSCPWCGLSFDDAAVSAADPGPVFLSVALVKERFTGPMSAGDRG